VAVGIHTGTIVVFEVTVDKDSFLCQVADSQRSHWHPISDLASTALPALPASASSASTSMRDILTSADESGLINVWTLGAKHGDGIERRAKVAADADSGPVTAMCLWNRVGRGILLAAHGSTGRLRLLSLPSGTLIAQVVAHAGWITGMDLAARTGVLVTCSEDGAIRVSR